MCIELTQPGIESVSQIGTLYGVNDKQRSLFHNNMYHKKKKKLGNTREAVVPCPESPKDYSMPYDCNIFKWSARLARKRAFRVRRLLAPLSMMRIPIYKTKK